MHPSSRRTFFETALALLLAIAGTLEMAGSAHAADSALERTLTVDGRARTYLVFAPAHRPARAAAVFVLHGDGGNARQMERFSRFDEVAEREGFVVIYPEAIEGHWNDGRGVQSIRAQRENIDDVKFMRAILAQEGPALKLDPGRIYASGFSNGGFMAHRLAAEASERFAAVAPVAGGVAPGIARGFNPKYPVSILIMQGDADHVVPIGGGAVKVTGSAEAGAVMPTKETLALYLTRSGNGPMPESRVVAVDERDGREVVASSYPDGAAGFKTSYFLVKKGGHAWPGALIGSTLHAPDHIELRFSATEEIWKFFASCPPRKLAAK